MDSSSDIFTGKLWLFIGDNPVAFEKSCKLTLSTDEIDISNKSMGDWAGSMAGKKSFTITSDSLTTYTTGLTSVSTLMAAQINSTVLTFKLAVATASDADAFGGTFTPDTENESYTGKCIITSLEVTGEAGQIATCAATFKGIGALSITAAV